MWLLELPNEVRQTIWIYALKSDFPLRRYFHWESPRGNGPGSLLCVNHAIHDDCVLMFYSQNVFFLRCPQNLRFSSSKGEDLPSSTARQDEVSLAVGFGRRYLTCLKNIAIRLPASPRNSAAWNPYDQSADVLHWLLLRAESIHNVELRFYLESNVVARRGAKASHTALVDLLTKCQKIVQVMAYHDIKILLVTLHALFKDPLVVHALELLRVRSLIQRNFPRLEKHSGCMRSSTHSKHLAVLKQLSFGDIESVGFDSLKHSSFSSKVICVQWSIVRGCDGKAWVPRLILDNKRKSEAEVRKKRFALLSLPREIRDMIWSSVMTFDGTVVRIPCGGVFQSGLTLPCCSRQVELECGKLLYENNEVRIDLPLHTNFSLRTDAEKSAILGLPLRYVSSLRGLVLQFDSMHWFSVEGIETMIWIRDHATSVQKITINIFVDLLEDYIGSFYLPTEPGPSFDVFFQFFRYEKRIFKILRSFPNLNLLDVSIGLSPYGDRWLHDDNVVKQRALVEVCGKGVDGKGMRDMKGKCFNQATRLAHGGTFLKFRNGPAKWNQTWRWVIELDTRTGSKKSTKLYKKPFARFEDVLAGVLVPTFEQKVVN